MGNKEIKDKGMLKCKSCKQDIPFNEDVCPYCGRRQSVSKWFYIKIDIKNWFIAHKKHLLWIGSIVALFFVIHIVLASINSPRTVTKKFFREFNDDNFKGVASCIYEEDSYFCTQYIINYHEKYEDIRDDIGSIKMKSFQVLRRKFTNAVGKVKFTIEVEEEGVMVKKEVEEVIFFTKKNGDWYFQFYPMYSYTGSLNPNIKANKE